MGHLLIAALLFFTATALDSQKLSIIIGEPAQRVLQRFNRTTGIDTMRCSPEGPSFGYVLHNVEMWTLPGTITIEVDTLTAKTKVLTWQAADVPPSYVSGIVSQLMTQEQQMPMEARLSDAIALYIWDKPETRLTLRYEDSKLTFRAEVSRRKS